MEIRYTVGNGCIYYASRLIKYNGLSKFIQVAEACAKHYYDRQDGYEREWPITIRLWDKRDGHIGDYQVELGHEHTLEAKRL